MGQQLSAREYKVSRTLMLDELGQAMDNGDLVITNTGCADKLKAEFGTIQRSITEARNIKYVTPNGTHDDLVVSVAMLFWGLKQALLLKGQFTGVRHRRIEARERVSAGGWT